MPSTMFSAVTAVGCKNAKGGTMAALPPHLVVGAELDYLLRRQIVPKPSLRNVAAGIHDHVAAAVIEAHRASILAGQQASALRCPRAR